MIFLVACSTNSLEYVSDSAKYSSFGLDSHDIEKMTEEITIALQKHRFTKSIKDKDILAIGDIEDKTSIPNFDVSELSHTLLEKIEAKTDKFIITTAIAGSGGKVDVMIDKSRKLRNNEEFDQYTTIETGELKSPHYSLSGSIIEKESVTKDGKERIDYILRIKISDLQKGTLKFNKAAIITKVRDKSSATNDTDISHRTFRKDYDRLPTISIGSHYFVIGANVGIANIGSFNFDNFSLRPYGYRDILGHSTDNINASFPVNLRLGYMFDIADNWAVTINATFGTVAISFDNFYDITIISDYSGKWTSYESVYSSDIKVQQNNMRLGGEILATYYLNDYFRNNSFGIFGGVGISRDIKSNITFNVGTTKIVKKSEAWHPIIKAGIIWYPYDIFGVSWEMNYSWAMGDNNYVSQGFGWGVIGLQLRI